MLASINIREEREQKKKLCLVIPTLNEKENIKALWARIANLASSFALDTTVLVIDDNSADGTAAIVKEAMQTSGKIKLLQRPKPSGIGSAYVDGFKFGLAQLNCDYLGEMDADLQHPPEALVKMCEMASLGSDVVLGSRYIKGGGSSDWSFSRRLVSKGANLLSKIFIRAPVSDATSGFRILSAKAVKGLLGFEISSKGYAFQVETLYVYKKLGMTFAEVPYVFEERKVGKTKLGAKEVLRFAYIVIKVGIFGIKKRKES